MTMQSNHPPETLGDTTLAACLKPFPASAKIHVAGTRPG